MAFVSTAFGAERGHEAPSSSIRFIPQIDGLRAVAVGLVFTDHYLMHAGKIFHQVDGVLLFFVISGFLITKVLLSYRNEMERSGVSLGNALRVFCIRRALRIFPAYYLLLAAMIGVGATTSMASWHLTYTTNIWSAIYDRWAPDAGMHFWTVAVQGQFYLFWPLMILLTPRRILPWAMLALIAVGFGFRLAAIYWEWGLDRRVLLLGNLHSLLAGALLGWAHHIGYQQFIDLVRRYGWIALIVTFAVPRDRGDLLFYGALWPIAFTLASVYLVDQATRNTRNWWSSFLALPPIVYIGTISYGLYLCHMFVRDMIGWHFPHNGSGLLANTVIWTAGAVLVASASWFLIEKPIMSLKSRAVLTPSTTKSP